MPTPTRFTKATLPFLASAPRQRDPEWLTRERETFERILKTPFVTLAKALERALKPEAPRYHFPTKGIGRIQIPSFKVGRGDPLYKDWLSIRVSIPTGSRFDYNPHCFFGLLPNEPGWEGVYVVGGLYKPKSEQIRRVRRAIADDPKPFHDLFTDPKFRARFRTDFSRAESNVRVPRDFDPAHPDIAWIKLKTFVVAKKIPPAIFTSADLADEVIKDFRQLLRLNQLLLEALAD